MLLISWDWKAAHDIPKSTASCFLWGLIYGIRSGIQRIPNNSQAMSNQMLVPTLTC